MAFRTDAGGFAFKANDAKIQAGASTWGTRLSQLAHQSGTVRIVTYSLPNVDYVRQQLGRRPDNILLIAHTKFRDKAIEINRVFPRIRLALHSACHMKMLLIEPHTVTITSANFGKSDWLEMGVSFHSKEAYDHCAGVFDAVWRESEEVNLDDYSML